MSDALATEPIGRLPTADFKFSCSGILTGSSTFLDELASYPALESPPLWRLGLRIRKRRGQKKPRRERRVARRMGRKAWRLIATRDDSVDYSFCGDECCCWASEVEE